MEERTCPQAEGPIKAQAAEAVEKKERRNGREDELEGEKRQSYG